MLSNRIPAKVERFSLPKDIAMDTTVAIPTVKGTWRLKYGKHAYYFMNFRTSEGYCISVSHYDIIRAGVDRLRKANPAFAKRLSIVRRFLRKYHYDFNYIEQVMLMTVPHTVTSIGQGRFIVGLWSYFGFLIVDLRAKAVTFHSIEEAEEDSVLGSRQWFDPRTDELYAMSYSLKDSFARIEDHGQAVSARIFKHRIGSTQTETIWSGEMADYMHDIVVNENRQYCVACELGMYLDAKEDIIPSKVMILDLKNNKQWTLERFIVAAHAQFDPQDRSVIYFSNHNFQFVHSNIAKLLKNATYGVKFRGPASVHKYRLSPEGPCEIGVFTHPDFYRLTNLHVFEHRGRHIIAAMGFPDEVFLLDAEKMSFIRKLRVDHPHSIKHLYSRKPAMVGTISPSLDGEKLFVHTTKSFQVVDIATGKSDYVRDYFFNHSCSNHMLTSSDTDW